MWGMDEAMVIVAVIVAGFLFEAGVWYCTRVLTNCRVTECPSTPGDSGETPG
jgi:hypothetical protein